MSTAQNKTPAPQSEHRAPRGYFKSHMADDRAQWGEGPLEDGHCDTCGADLPTETTRRGDKRRFCSAGCRQWWRTMETAAGRFLLNATLRTRMFKHADPDRSNHARTEIANYMAEFFEWMDIERSKTRASNPAAGIVTLEEIRTAAKQRIKGETK